MSIKEKHHLSHPSSHSEAILTPFRVSFKGLHAIVRAILQAAKIERAPWSAPKRDRRRQEREWNQVSKNSA
ncbi:MAG: hypothetical protein ACJKTH_01425 [Patescibacteria group bacterium UBA2163]